MRRSVCSPTISRAPPKLVSCSESKRTRLMSGKFATWIFPRPSGGSNPVIFGTYERSRRGRRRPGDSLSISSACPSRAPFEPGNRHRLLRCLGHGAGGSCQVSDHVCAGFAVDLGPAPSAGADNESQCGSRVDNPNVFRIPGELILSAGLPPRWTFTTKVGT